MDLRTWWYGVDVLSAVDGWRANKFAGGNVIMSA